MELTVTSAIGLLAGICTTGSLLPQVYKTIKSRNARDISLLMYVLLSAGIFLWFVYGLLLNEMPIMLANGVSLILTMGVLMLKIKHG
jgi:MtN3 and saliva related transmembrane protein